MEFLLQCRQNEALQIESAAFHGVILIVMVSHKPRLHRVSITVPAERNIANRKVHFFIVLC